MELLVEDLNEWLKEKPKMIEVIEGVIKAALEEESFSTEVEISLILTDNKRIKQINHDHRNIDQVTDVISFPQIDWASEFVSLNEAKIILGDIVISTDKLEDQAKEYDHSLERELGFLVAHSMFHLLGYDHMEEEEEEQMIAKQEKVLEGLGLVR